MSRKIAYVAGPYSAGTLEKRNSNVAEADRVGRELFAKGYAVVVPHKMTMDWEHDERFVYDDFVDQGKALIGRCHVVVCCKGWQESKGSCLEVEWARGRGIPIYEDASMVPSAKSFEGEAVDIES